MCSSNVVVEELAGDWMTQKREKGSSVQHHMTLIPKYMVVVYSDRYKLYEMTFIIQVKNISTNKKLTVCRNPTVIYYMAH